MCEVQWNNYPTLQKIKRRARERWGSWSDPQAADSAALSAAALPWKRGQGEGLQSGQEGTGNGLTVRHWTRRADAAAGFAD